ncbi:hypothetical protein [Streptomyces griseus]|uniref:hypothetical protein n=1 Tax=Streptomyces griseus TaxID=1911 RepID=UPI0004C50A55|nr:hypothetical protein [Streptomyces griseus]
MNTKSVLTTSFLALSMAMASTTAAVADDAPTGNGLASLVGPVLAPPEAGEADAPAVSPGEHVNANACDTSSAVLGADLPTGPKATDCTAASTAGSHGA